MEKILLAVNVSQVNIVPLDFACWLAKLTHSKLTGVLLENIKGSSVPAMKSLHGMPYVETIVSTDLRENAARKNYCDEYIRLFDGACDRRVVRSAIHRDSRDPLEEIVRESRFADLMVVDPEISFDGGPRRVPSEFVESLLGKAECPVVLSPSSFDGIEEIVLAYDGSASSVFAIKQFSYLLPELSDKRVIVTQVHKKQDWSVKERKQIGELLQPHFSAVGFHTLVGDPDEALFEFLLKKKNAFLVMGSYGRTAISRYFHRSTSSLLARVLNLPIFIAHH